MFFDLSRGRLKMKLESELMICLYGRAIETTSKPWGVSSWALAGQQTTGNHKFLQNSFEACGLDKHIGPSIPSIPPSAGRYVT